MSRSVRALILVALALVCSASRLAAQNPAGLPTQARVYVLNAARTDAVAVKLIDAEPLRVVVNGVPAVTAQTQVARQRWEYRTVSVPRGGDPSTQLNVLGNDGWETTGVAYAVDGGVNVVVKRPRQ
jgi:hypothetical protein